jgi:hypothetical protein
LGVAPVDLLRRDVGGSRDVLDVPLHPLCLPTATRSCHNAGERVVEQRLAYTLHGNIVLD